MLGNESGVARVELTDSALRWRLAGVEGGEGGALRLLGLLDERVARFAAALVDAMVDA